MVGEVRHFLTGYQDYYNRVRLHSAIGYVAPLDKLEGRGEAIWAPLFRTLKTSQANCNFAASERRKFRKSEASREL